MSLQDMKIKELVGKVDRGEIRLPEMQRQYVWRASQVRDLLDSLYRGYPAGTVLTWETDEPAPTRAFSVAQDTQPKRYQLLLDGQQRLTSLSAIINGKPIMVRNRKTPIDILFNLEHPAQLEVMTEVHEGEQDHDAVEEVDENDSERDEETADASEDEMLARFKRMAFVGSFKKLAARTEWVSVTDVFKTPDNTPFLIRAGVSALTDPKAQLYNERLNRLRAIADYMYRVEVLDRDKSYDEVTEIFVRVNSLGAKLRGSDLALARITATWPNSLKIFQEFETKCLEKGFDFGLALYIKTLVSFATGQSRFKTVGSLSKEQLIEAWQKTKDAINYSLNFLTSNTGIDSPTLMASPFLAITLAYFGHHKNFKLTSDEERQLRYWALTANAKGRYSRGSSETFLDQDLSSISKTGTVDALLKLLETQAGRLHITPSDLEGRSSRSAYFKTMFLAFRAAGAKDWGDQLSISLKHSGAKHALEFHHIFPQAQLKGKEPNEINDIANLAFISSAANKTISKNKPASYIPAYIAKNGAEMFEKQCIPLTLKLLEIENYQDFLAERRVQIAERLNEFLGNPVSFGKAGF